MMENDIRKPTPPNAALYDINDPILTGLYNDGAGNLDMHRDGVKTITFYSTHTLFRQAIVISDSDVSDIEPRQGEALLFINDGKLSIKDSSGIRNVIMQNDRTRVAPDNLNEYKEEIKKNLTEWKLDRNAQFLTLSQSMDELKLNAREEINEIKKTLTEWIRQHTLETLDENRLKQVQDLIDMRKAITKECHDSMDSLINTFGIQITNMFDDHRSTISTLTSEIDRHDINEFIFNTNMKLDKFKTAIETELDTYIKKDLVPRVRVLETTLTQCVHKNEYEKQIMENMYIKISNQDLSIYTSGAYIDNGESVKLLDVLTCIDIFVIDDLAVVIVETLDNKTAIYFYEICGMILIRQSKYKLNMTKLLYVSLQYTDDAPETPNIVFQNENTLTAIRLDYDRIADRSCYNINYETLIKSSRSRETLIKSPRSREILIKSPRSREILGSMPEESLVLPLKITENFY